MIYDILEKKLTDSGLVVAGQSLFRNYMPPECKIGVMIRTPLTGIEINPFIEGWHKTSMQVITRHVDPVEGARMAAHVSRLLIVEAPEKHEASDERGPAHINVFYPSALPIQYPRLEGNGLEFSQHFTAAFGFKPDWRS
ncbi:hypothetical protein IB265_33290 [Ensifer sp. ENS10]|uniref:phage tail terminator protein n=1 Tax=Ensifer sp. ENS10 TaxID=2769286 RepID=UPI00177E4B4D|nr:minor capsid protein [Ensifer sp. ENS10]MBD9511632.1 hypothetical protein [Ensifer sp. ENS10]